MRLCTLPGCDHELYAKGLCQKHYKHERRGKPLTEKSQKDLSPLEKFQQKYSVTESGCWEWKYRRPDGRANTFRYQEKTQSAYRASYQMHIGPIPDGMNVCHSCDNGLCVNPDHLWIGTQKDNIADMDAKGRRGRKGKKKDPKVLSHVV